MESAFLSVLRCAGCGAGRLVARAYTLECPQCGRVFPVQAGIPVMIGDARPERGPLLDPAVASAVMARLGIQADPITMLRVRRASGARVRLREGALLQDGRVLAGVPGAPQSPAVPAGEGRLRCEWLRDYLPRAMGPGLETLAHVQFRNVGRAVMPSAGPGRVAVSHTWDSAGDGVRTKLLADVAPGQIVTIPLRLRTPAETGPHRLTVTLVQEGGAALEPGYGPIGVDIRDKACFVPPPHWATGGPAAADPAADHRRAVGLMRDWLAQLGAKRPRVLEWGGGAVSQSARAGYDTVKVDGDLLALQLGRLAPGPSADALCADAAALPLAECAFDAIVCFGALQFAADPAQTLRGLRRHLRPGGFIGLFCEPVGHLAATAPTDEALADWRRGLNTQAFTPAEYAAIVRSAGLSATAFIVEGVSLKARLEPEGTDA